MEPKLTDRLHAAIQTGAWSTAQELLASFRQEVETSWLTASTEQERRDISQNVTGFLQWARAMTMIDREHTHSRLNRLKRRQAYAGPNASNPHRGLDA
jgi:hypothetical protein